MGGLARAGVLAAGLMAASVAHAKSPFDLSAGIGAAGVANADEGAGGIGFDLFLGARLGEHVTVGGLASTTAMYPMRTVALCRAAIDVGEWTTGAFVSVYEWSGRDSGSDTWNALKLPLSIFAYTGLLMSYMAVPALIVMSPFASLGQAAVGPVVRVDTGTPPDLFVEGGAQALIFSLPSGDSGLGAGPVVGLGVHLAEALTIGGRLMVSPPGWHDSVLQGDGALFTGGVYIGL